MLIDKHKKNRYKTNIQIGKYEIPRIGLRIIKSALAVFLCYLVDIVRNGEGIVFYSQLAALWCMQDYVSETKSKAKQRTAGTFIGAFWGLLVIIIYRYICNFFTKPPTIIYGLMVSVAIILVLYSTVILKKKQASYFSCVVLLSIVVIHIEDSNPFIFVFNRVLDTMIGIGVGVAVNCFSIKKNRNKDILFLSGLDDTLLAENGEMSDYSRVELNRLIEDGAHISISTIRTPASLMSPLSGIRLKLPVIVMDGAALFNIAEKRYEYVYVISPEKSNMIKNWLDEREISYFTNIIIDDVLMIYYQKTDNGPYNELISKLRSSPYRNYINREVPTNESVVYYLVIDKSEKIEELYNAIMMQDWIEQFKIVISPSTEISGCSLLKIYNRNACKENMTEYLSKMIGIDTIVTFGTIPGKYDYCIDSGDFNKVVKLIKQRYEAK